MSSALASDERESATHTGIVKHDTLGHDVLPSMTPLSKDTLPCTNTDGVVQPKLLGPRQALAIQYALAVAFIVASVLAALFATTCLARFIWRSADTVFAKLAHISDASPDEIERSRREVHPIAVCDHVKVVMTRRYVHSMRYWQEMAMTVVELSNHTFFYNPVPIPLDDMRALANGKQVVIVVPNMYHHMFVDDYVNTFPSAVLVGSQCAAKRHAPRLAVALPSTVALPADVELLHVDGWALDEYIMVVHGARLLVAAHFISCGIELAVGGATLLPAWLQRLVCKATGWQPAGCLPRYERLAVFDKTATASFVSGLHNLDFETCISAHGGICKDNASEVLQRAWGWIS